MLNLLRGASVMVCLVASAPLATADELKLSMSNGRVTLIAQDVPLRQILAEWARIGETKIVNADRLVGPPLTLQLIDRPEREVLNVILRSAAGYVAAPRATAHPGLATFDRILILATSQPPAYTPSAQPPATYLRPPPQPMQVPDDDTVEPSVIQQGVVPPGAGPVQPNVPPTPLPAAAPQPGQPQPGLTLPRPGMLPQPVNPTNPYGPNQAPVVRPPGMAGGVIRPFSPE